MTLHPSESQQLLSALRSSSAVEDLELAKSRLLGFEWRRGGSLLRHELVARHPLALVGGAVGAGMLVTGSAAVRGLLWAGMALGLRRMVSRAIYRRLRY